MHVTRRDLLKLGSLTGIAGLAVAAPLGGLQAKDASRLPDRLRPRPFQVPFGVPPVLAPRREEVGADGVRVQYFDITQREGTAPILRGSVLTRFWGYEGMLPGPTLRVTRRTRTVVRMRNALPARHPLFRYEFATSTHLHGSPSLPQYDGYANDLTRPGQRKDYVYGNEADGRTLWYHDHAAHVTSENVYTGLVGQYHVIDPDEAELVPQNAFDVPLTVADAMFDEQGQLAFDDHSESGLWGDVVLVNGRPWPVMPVQRRVYRFRVLNASVARSFRFRLSTGEPVLVVGTDGGLVPVAQPVTSWRHAPGERYEVLIDFRPYRPGTRVRLANLSNDDNIDFDDSDEVMAFDVTDEPVDTSDPTWDQWPSTLVTHPVMQLQESQAVRRRRLRVERQGGEWTINDRTWGDVERSGFTDVVANPGLGDVEVWEFENRSGGWFHPMHIHLVDFRILSRNGRPPFPYERGPKDVVYAGENETVRLLMRFGPHAGRYMVHCHNLAHEDHDMMLQLRVGPVPVGEDPADPIAAARPVQDDGSPV